MNSKKGAVSLRQPLFFDIKSIVLTVDFEVCLRVIAGRAYVGSLGSYDDVSAVSALPDLDFDLFEYGLGFHVLKESSVSLFVMLLDGSYLSELVSQFRETFFFSGLGKAFVHVCPLEVLAVSSCLQVSCCVADTFQFFEPHFSVLFFVLSGFQEESGNLLISFLLSLRSEICVFVAGLRLSCECLP